MTVSRFASAITAAAGCAVIGLIVASCSNQVGGSPTAPGVSSNLAAHLETSPTPTPDVSPTPTPTGTPCSPGYWKNHLDAFNQYCDAAAALDGSDAFSTCDQLMTALTCKGSDASCGRTAAATLLDTVSGCFE